MKRILTTLLALVLMLACFTTASACTEWCGVIGPFFDTEIDSEEELALEAIQRINKDGDDIIGKRAIVHHYGNLRASANKYADSVGIAAHEDEYLITDYTIVDGKVWLKVVYGSNLAWISASLVEISGGGGAVIDGDDKYRDSYIGKTCRVIVNSGRARMAPDVNAPIVEYIRYNEKYTVLDVASAPDNTLWFQIRKDGNLCWTSSGNVGFN